ncbi:MAG: anion permease [Candidatus Hodarchaeota archaeon]
MSIDLVLIVVIVLLLVVAFAIGSNDEAMAPVVGAGIMSLSVAVFLGGFLSALGAILLGQGVSETVGSDLIKGEELPEAAVVAVLLAMAIWLVAASVGKGLPISTTQATVGSVCGVAIYYWGTTDAVDWAVVIEILIGWVISPIIGFIGAALTFIIVEKIRHRAAARGLSDVERQERIAGYLLAIFLLWSSFSRGGNDVANGVAPLISYFDEPIYALILGGIGMAVGLIIIGRKVVETLAHEVVALSPSSALSASISVAVIMFVGTAMGLPISGSHVLVAALIAVGWAGKTQVEKEAVKGILVSWVITVPISAVLGIALFAILEPSLAAFT